MKRKLLPFLLLLALSATQCTSGRAKQLWPGSRYTDQDRDAAVERGLAFIDRMASNPKHLSTFGHDLLWCFYTISNTAKNEHLRATARRMGQEHAREWMRLNTQVPQDDAVALFNFVTGIYYSERLLGIHDEALRKRVESAAAKYSVYDFLAFDPRLEPPPSDIPESCPRCSPRNPHKEKRCPRCKPPLTLRNRYDVWLDALIMTYTGDHYGVKLGASYPEVVRWISVMRPYPATSHLKDNEDEFNDVTYAITHVIYTLNEYGTYRLSPQRLPEEFDYLKTNLAEAKQFQDQEIIGEFLDTLRAFGRNEADPEMREGVDYLLSHQNPDGSWGPLDERDQDDIHNRYHSTWTAVDGLREYSFQGERVQFPSTLPAPQEKKSVSILCTSVR